MNASDGSVVGAVQGDPSVVEELYVAFIESKVMCT